MKEIDELGNKELFFLDIYHLSLFPLLFVSRDGLILFINKGFAKLLDRTVEGLIGLTCKEIFSRDSQYQLDSFFKKIFLTNTLQTCDVRVNLSDDRIRFLKLEGAFESGKCIITGIDITEIKMVELTSISVQADLLSILDAIPELLFEVDLDGNLHRYHTKRKELLYAPVDKIVGSNLIDMLPSDIANMSMNAILHANEYGHTFGIQYDLPIEEEIKSFEMSVTKKMQANVESPRFLIINRDITAQKKLENDLLKSEIRYKGLFENLNVGTVVHAPDTSILMNNERAKELLGEMDNEFIGKKGNDQQWHFLLEDNTICPQEMYPVYQILNSKRPMQNQTFGVFRNRSKDIVWLNVNGFPILDEEGNILEIVISFIDITARKSVEDTLRVSQANMEAILDNSTDGILFIDPNKRIQFFNQVAKRHVSVIFGVKLYFGLSIESFLNGHELFFFEQNFQSALDGKIISFEKTYPYESNKHWFLIQLAPIRNEGQEVIGVLFTAKDIDVEKKMELDLIRTEFKFQQIFDKAPLGIALIESRTGRLMQVNHKLNEILQYNSEELLQLNFQDFIFVDDLLKNLDTFRLFRERNVPLISMEIRCIQKNKNIIWVNVNYVPLNTAEELGVYHLAIFSDITQIKITEEKNQSYLNSSEKLNKTKDKFFNIIAHDLRNPFAGIIGLAEMLENKSLHEVSETAKESQRIAKLIHTSSKSAFALLENLMQWAKTQTGDIKFSPRMISIEPIINSVLQVVNANSFKKRITILTDLERDIKVFADSAMTETILRNLLANAIKFSFLNSEILIKTRVKNNFLEISVIDRGTGIAADNIDKLFRIESKFTKLGTNSEKGTGLGLILCKEFVEKQGGDISVISEIGKGSIFTFTLPLSEQKT